MTRLIIRSRWSKEDMEETFGYTSDTVGATVSVDDLSSGSSGSWLIGRETYSASGGHRSGGDSQSISELQEGLRLLRKEIKDLREEIRTPILF